MSQIDQDKIKDLLYGIVSDIFDCLPDNQYVQTEKKSAFDRITNANLLTDQAPCATVKKEMTKGQLGQWLDQDSDVVLSIEHVDGEYPVNMTRTPTEPDNVGYQ